MISLSSLPPELLRDAIEATVPHSYHSTTYEDRQSTLCSLSLVSRTFRAIAQPLLFEIVSIDMDAQLRSFLGGRYDTLQPKEAIVGCYVTSEGTRGLLSRLKGLQSLSIVRESRDPIGLEVLLEHVKLVNLQLSGFGFYSAGPLTSLRSLSFDYTVLESSAPLLLDPEVLPSLQALGLDEVTEVAELQKLEESNLSRLLPQLDAVVVHWRLYRLASDTLFAGHSHRILVDVHSQNLGEPDMIQLLSTVQHIRIKAFSTFTLEASTAILTFLAACREPENSSLQSIYLPLELHPSRLESARSGVEIQRVMEECKKGGIEVVFETHPVTFLDHYISREFWDRQRRSPDEERQM